MVYEVAPGYFRLKWDEEVSYESNATMFRYNGGTEERGNQNKLNIMLRKRSISCYMDASEYAASNAFLERNFGKPFYIDGALYICESFSWSVQSANLFSLNMSLEEVIRPVGLKEGNSGNKTYTFALFREGFTDQPLEVFWIVSIPSYGSANADDFGGVLPSGNVTFNVNENTKFITVTASGDNIAELDETIHINTFNDTNTRVLVYSRHGIILDDDLSV